MPVTTMSHPAQAQGKASDKQASKAAVLTVPFTRAAKEHLEPFIDEAKQLNASAQQLGPFDVPAYGFVRGIYLNVTATLGAGGAAVIKEDAPWSVIDSVEVIDVNGAPLFGPFTGYELYLVNKYGGFRGDATDPRQPRSYSAPDANGNFKFMLRIPHEICARDGLGSLANQNAASTYKVKITLAPSASVFSTPPATTLPTVRVRAHLDAWTQPTQTDLRGNPNATQPPAQGTTMYWSKTSFNLSSGFQNIRLPRVGNYLRELIFIYRATADGLRATGDGLFPDPLSIYWDTRTLKSVSKDLWLHLMAERTGYVAAAGAIGGLDNGVYVEDYCHEFNGRLGYELRDGWLPTAQSTRLEVQGNFTGAGVLTVLTCDVAPAGEIFV